MSDLIYSGIGSRQTPQDILELMISLGALFAQQGYILRSGGCIGADKAFERGCNMEQGKKEIYLAHFASPASIEIASKYHPAWDKCSGYAKKLHGRNVQIVLGQNLDTPVKFLVVWTPGGEVVGGTGMAMRLALDRGIPIRNLFDEKVRKLAELLVW